MGTSSGKGGTGTTCRDVVTAVFEIGRRGGAAASLRPPERHRTVCRRIAREIGSRRPFHLRDERSRLRRNECADLSGSVDEVLRHDGKRRIADSHKQADSMTLHCCEFVRLVPDALVVRHRDPALCAGSFQPLLIRSVGGEEVSVSDDGEAGGDEDAREF